MTLFISAFFLALSVYHLFHNHSYNGAIYHLLLSILFMIYYTRKGE